MALSTNSKQSWQKEILGKARVGKRDQKRLPAATLFSRASVKNGQREERAA